MPRFVAEVGARPIAAGVERGVVVWSHARALVGTLRPQSWVVLHDLVFDAEWVDGRWVAPSSARLVAEHLRIDPGTAAAALRQLRDCGVAELTQASGSAGRFGLAVVHAAAPVRHRSGVAVCGPAAHGRQRTRSSRTRHRTRRVHNRSPRPSGRRRAAAAPRGRRTPSTSGPGTRERRGVCLPEGLASVCRTLG